MNERGTGIFGQMKNEEISSNSDKDITPVKESNPCTIYNLLFEQYDEEKE